MLATQGGAIMSHCVVSYSGRKVSFHEGGLECAVAILWSEAAKELSTDPERAEKCSERLAEWRHHASNCGVGQLRLDFEEMLRHDAKLESEFLQYIGIAEVAITAIGDRVPAEWLQKTVNIADLIYCDCDTTVLLDPLNKLKRLIRGDVGIADGMN